MILGVETSCDDTCAAVVTAEGEVLSNCVASQGLLHERYGGVVPEVAARRHLELIDAVIADSLERANVGIEDIEVVAATQGPGLIGALLVGFSAAKALACARGLAFVPVDHLRAHVLASTLDYPPVEPPFISLVASGGHTFIARVDDLAEYRTLGQTLDDSAGEAFDKGARTLSLSYPGGPAIDRIAREGDPEAFAFPRAFPGEGLDFSFSGLKTSLLYKVKALDRAELDRVRASLACSFQAAIVDVLTARLAEAVSEQDLSRVSLGGGVAANSALRDRVLALSAQMGFEVWVPPLSLCTDNAAMIAGAGRFSRHIDYPFYLDIDASARL
jgi:N6-L-threonylcarbamoyladenine synthase